MELNQVFQSVKQGLSIAETFQATIAKTLETIDDIDRRDSIHIRDIVENQKKKLEIIVDFDVASSTVEKAKYLGMLAALNQWIIARDKEDDENEKMYAYYCQNHPDEVPPEDYKKYANWIITP